MPERRPVAVLGGGSFGTVIANIIAANGHDVRLWMRSGERAGLVNSSRENPDYLPGYTLHEGLQAMAELDLAVRAAEFVFMAVPGKSCREVASEVAGCIEPAATVISTTKGIEADRFQLMSEVLTETLPGNPLAVLSGPNLAREIAAGQLTGTVVASADPAINAAVQQLLRSGNFRVYSSGDMFGVELAGTLKNVYAIMSGMGAALGVGENTRAMLLTRSLAEMCRFAAALGADPMTFLGLAGVGDLFVSCSSPLSRNYRVGFALGKGQALDDVLEQLGQVAEGVNTLRLLKAEAAQRAIYMPLVAGLYAILYERQSLPDIIGGLMLAEQSRDVEFSLREQNA